MTDSSTEPSPILWNLPECPFSIEASARVLDDIRLTVTDAFFSLPRGGAEIGGILLGRYQNNHLVISDYAALDCEHAFGPSFTLSPNDDARLTSLLEVHSAAGFGAGPVGWYHSHTRSEIFLSDADLAIHQTFFAKPFQIAIVLKPHTFQPMRLGLFFRDSQGKIHAEAPYQEVTLTPLGVRPTPSSAPEPEPEPPPASTYSSPHVQPHRPEQVPLPLGDDDSGPVLDVLAEEPDDSAPPAAPRFSAPLREPARHEPEAPSVRDIPLPKFAVETESSTRKWMFIGIGAVALLGIGGAAFQAREMWLPRVLNAVRPVPVVTPPQPVPAPALGLSIFDREGQLHIGWDRTSPAIRRATDAVLEISDGGPTPVAVQLDAAHLETGSFTYARTAEKVDVKLIVHQKDGPDIRELSSFLGKLPERAPEPDPPTGRRGREESARQNAKLKADMSSQAAKTKRLEKEVQSMREELRQQQLRRLNNQLGGK